MRVARPRLVDLSRAQFEPTSLLQRHPPDAAPALLPNSVADVSALARSRRPPLRCSAFPLHRLPFPVSLHLFSDFITHSLGG
eukprot:contig_10752_g2565